MSNPSILFKLRECGQDLSEGIIASGTHVLVVCFNWNDTVFQAIQGEPH